MANESEKKQKWASIVSPMFGICSAFGVLLILFTFFEWDLVDFLTPFLLVPMLFLFWIIFVSLMIGSLIYLGFQIKKNYQKALLPFLVNILVFLILWLVPFTDIRLEIQFRMNRPGYEEVVAMVNNSTLVPGEYGFVNLPQEYQHLSTGGGDIIVDQTDGVTSIFFYTFRGVLDNSSGFIYRSNDTQPGQFLLGQDCIQLEKIEPFWYFCASN
jgi:hypothetical protein